MITCGPDMVDILGHKWKRRDWNTAYSVGPNQVGLPHLQGLAYGCGNPFSVKGWRFLEDTLAVALAVRRDEVLTFSGGSRVTFMEGYCEFTQARTVKVGPPDEIAAYLAKWYKGPINYLKAKSEERDEVVMAGHKGVAVSKQGSACAGDLGLAVAGKGLAHVGTNGTAVLQHNPGTLVVGRGSAFSSEVIRGSNLVFKGKTVRLIDLQELDIKPDTMYYVNSKGSVEELSKEDPRQYWRMIL